MEPFIPAPGQTQNPGVKFSIRDGRGQGGLSVTACFLVC